MNEPRPGKKLLVIDIDYTIFDLGSSAEQPMELARCGARASPLGSLRRRGCVEVEVHALSQTLRLTISISQTLRLTISIRPRAQTSNLTGT